MFRVLKLVLFSVLLSACGGGESGSAGDQNENLPPQEALSGAWEGALVYQSSQNSEAAKLAIFDGQAWIKIEGDRAAGLKVVKGGDKVTLSGTLQSGWPPETTMMGNAFKHPAYKDLLADSPEIEIEFTLEGRDAVGSFEILGAGGSVTEFGVFSLLPITLADGSIFLSDIPEAQITCGESGGSTLYCFSDIDLSIDPENQISGSYRDYHKYSVRPATMYSTIPSSFDISGEVMNTKEPGFFRIEMVAPRLESAGFGYRNPNGEIEYCLSGVTSEFSPTICP